MIIAPEREEREYETQEISEDIMAKTDANRFKKFSKPQAGLKKKKNQSECWNQRHKRKILKSARGKKIHDLQWSNWLLTLQYKLCKLQDNEIHI